VAELSASLAHEIKNPLASIRSSVEQLARVVQAGEDERFLAQLVLRESDRLSRLLNEFLEFSRVHVALSRPVDLAAVVRSAADVVRQHPACTPETEIRVTGSVPPIEGDEDLLHRVVANLLLNAVQAASGRVNVSVELRPARPSDLPVGVGLESAVLLRVADDGPGIPAELRDRLFDPFVTGRPGGSGLGLAVVHRAVQAHRGVILVESGPEHGTAFTILLPAPERR
jgi:two-component system sensor histidine kinase PilS (NtrC family)